MMNLILAGVIAYLAGGVVFARWILVEIPPGQERYKPRWIIALVLVSFWLPLLSFAYAWLYLGYFFRATEPYSWEPELWELDEIQVKAADEVEVRK